MLKAIKISGNDFLKSKIFEIAGASLRLITELKQINNAEVHKNFADLFFIVSGEVDFISDGELINPKKQPDDYNTFIAEEIKNGTKVSLKRNDWFFVPVNCPHQRITLKKSCFIIIKIPIK